MLKTDAILTPAREGGRFRGAARGQDPVAPDAQLECQFWVEFEKLRALSIDGRPGVPAEGVTAFGDIPPSRGKL